MTRRPYQPMPLPQWLDLIATQTRLGTAGVRIVQTMHRDGWWVGNTQYCPQTTAELAAIPKPHIMKFFGVGDVMASKILRALAAFGENVPTAPAKLPKVPPAEPEPPMAPQTVPMPQWEVIARQMCNTSMFEGLPFKLHARLKAVDNFCQFSGGRLYSRQVIAMIIEQYMREKGLS